MSSDPTIPPPPALSHKPPWDGRVRLRWTDLQGAHVADLEGTCVLGASENVDLQIANPTVSRVHAEIEMTSTGAWVRDLGSRNGTFVGRVQVKHGRLEPGLVLALGSAEISVDVPEEILGPELWPNARFGPLVGQSRPMRELFATLARIAKSDVPVFIRGETGSGKELVARAIHEASSRAAGPYMVVDCGALTPSLLESELFGHARGAFTGATHARLGAIEAADGGTVFLDEIGELPLEMQPKLLRVLEQRTVRRVGESEHRPVDVRFVAATHRDLVDSVARGWFREDLYFRLAVLPVRLPPLRERMDDLELLVRHFLGPQGSELITASLLAALALRPYRGNVRELRNVLDRVRALGEARALADEAPAPIASEQPPTSSGFLSAVKVPQALLELAHREFRERWSELGERVYLESKLAKHDGNISRLSREIELARTYTHKLIKKHGL